jgi:hypothetical protein
VELQLKLGGIGNKPEEDGKFPYLPRLVVVVFREDQQDLADTQPFDPPCAVACSWRCVFCHSA